MLSGPEYEAMQEQIDSLNEQLDESKYEQDKQRRLIQQLKDVRSSCFLHKFHRLGSHQQPLAELCSLRSICLFVLVCETYCLVICHMLSSKFHICITFINLSDKLNPLYQASKYLKKGTYGKSFNLY